MPGYWDISCLKITEVLTLPVYKAIKEASQEIYV